MNGQGQGGKDRGQCQDLQGDADGLPPFEAVEEPGQGRLILSQGALCEVGRRSTACLRA
jgi:hypothetical protein